MSNTVHNFKDASCIPCFSFNKNFNKIAISPNNELVQIYEKEGSQWALKTTLKDHTSKVYGIDWAKNSDKIVTCGADRNAYVWTETKPNVWQPSLVLLRITRAAISVSWSPLENKFAVGTGNKLACICYYEESNDWWVSKHIKKPIRSSILSVDWHPDNNLIAAGSSDFTCRIFSAAIKEVDKKPSPTGWGDKNAFGALLAEFSSKYGGWVHCVKFSPNGNQLAWVSHDCCVSVADNTKSDGYVYTLKLSSLPFVSCVWLSDDSFIAGGHDNKPYKFNYSNGEVKLDKCLDDGTKASGSTKTVSAMSKFQNLDKLAQTKGESSGTNSTHLNSIKQLYSMEKNVIATSALDTQIVVWNC